VKAEATFEVWEDLMRTVIAVFVLALMSSLGCMAEDSSASNRETSPLPEKTLWIADIDGGLIWLMDIQSGAILRSFPSPAQKDSPRFPIGLALLGGILYVNNFNFNFDCQTGNEMFALAPRDGHVLGATSVSACAIDGMASVPEAGVLLAIDSQTSPEQLLILRPEWSRAGLRLRKVDTIHIDVPGNAVRGLAYRKGQIFISTELPTQSGTQSLVYVYSLNLNKRTIVARGSIDLGAGIASPGLATCGDYLIAYSLGRNLQIVEAKPNGAIRGTISLENTAVGWVGALEAKCGDDVFGDDQ
jgi:hypothetical protein